MPAPKNLISARVVERRDLTDDLMIMKFELSVPFPFKPGQYCTMGIGDTERPYSIVSSPDEKHIEIFFELVPEKFRTEKSLTPRVWNLSVGDEVALRPKAKGIFILQENYNTQVMVATVTGIAPYISMLRARRQTYYERRKWHRPWFIFQGASYQNEFGYFEELQSYQNEGLITYIPTVSRPQEKQNYSWAGERGRVNVILKNIFSDFNIVPEGTFCYLCGNEGMIKYLGNKKPAPDQPLGTLIEQGFTVKEEVYF